MDSVKLNEEQMYAVITFIDDLGFHDREAISGILGPFVALIEEEMARSPGISVNTIMNEVYNRVGLPYFYSLSNKGRSTARKSYNVRYWSMFKKMVTHMPVIFLAVVVTFLSYYLYPIAEVDVPLWGNMNITGTFLIVAHILSLVIFSARFNAARDTFVSFIVHKDYFTTMVILVLVVNDRTLHKSSYLLSNVLCALCWGYYVVRTFAVFALLRSAQAETDLISNYLDNK